MSYRVAIIGGGAIAESHLEALQRVNHAAAVAIADVRAERALSLAAQFGGLTPYIDYKEMIMREKPDIVIISLPHYLHHDAAIFCIEAGCHVLLEKPMALNTQECDAISSAVKRSNVCLLVGHTQHYIAENLMAKQLIQGGELGQLVMINDVRHTDYFQASRPAWFLEKKLSGGGIIMNLGSHTVDKISWLGGSPITRVKASMSYHGTRGDVEGSGIAFLQQENGVPATLMQSGYPGTPRNETELVFTSGMIKLETGKKLWVSRGGAYQQMEVAEQESPLVLQILDLIECIELGREPMCTMEFSRSVIAVIEAMYRSNKSGQEEQVLHSR